MQSTTNPKKHRARILLIILGILIAGLLSWRGSLFSLSLMGGAAATGILDSSRLKATSGNEISKFHGLPSLISLIATNLPYLNER